MLGDAARLIVLSDHEAGEVLQEHQRDPALVAELDEVSALERGFGEQHPVVRHDTDLVPVDAGEPGDQGGTVSGLELVEDRAVDDPRNHLVHVVGLVHVHRDGPV